MNLRGLLVLSVLLFSTRASAQLTTAQLGSVDAQGRCTIRPTGGAAIYGAMVGARAQGGLSDPQLLHHAASRLGYGTSPIGPLTVDRANDCTTVFLADELDRQLVALGTRADTAQLARVRRGLLPLTLSPRVELNATLWRLRQAPENATLNAYGNLAFEARTELVWYKTLREILGSQRVEPNGVLADVQVNLEEVLAEFWLNHFNVNIERIANYYHGVDGFPEVVRRAQGGTFAALLRAALRHPGMITYLDNMTNRCDPVTDAASNQNLARELLELHTLGAGPDRGIYGQADVEAMASALCGWNAVPYGTVPASPDGFVYNSLLASPRPLTILGQVYPATGEARVAAILSGLARHNATRAHLCRKLSERFYAPGLAPAAASACVAAWGIDGDLRAMARRLIERPEFWQASNARVLLRNPIELVAAVARQLGVSVVDLNATTVAAGLTEAPFTLATLTPQSTIDAITSLRGQGPYKVLRDLGSRIRTLLGVARASVAPPTGYPMDGAAYLSAGYIDDVSRLGVDTAGALAFMGETYRTDLAAKIYRTSLDAKLAATSSNVALTWFLETQLRLFKVTTGGAPAPPYVLPASHLSTLRSVFATTTGWAFHSSAPSVKRSNDTVLGPMLSSAALLWR
jgi:uncharacterized protein (DUF1800 family)